MNYQQFLNSSDMIKNKYISKFKEKILESQPIGDKEAYEQAEIMAIKYLKNGLEFF